MKMKWIDVKEQPPEPEHGNKVLGYNEGCIFECEFDDGFWCSLGGDEMTHWMPLPERPSAQ
jgi:hypothetical protein